MRVQVVERALRAIRGVAGMIFGFFVKDVLLCEMDQMI